MSMSRRKLIVLLVALAPIGWAQDGPGLGEPVSAETLEAIDFVVLPDGQGLPAGQGDAVKGAELYGVWCVACHGEGGADGINDRLVGGHDSIAGARPQKTVGSFWPHATTLFDYIRRAMPYQSPGELSADEVYSLTAYILFLNGIVDETDVLDAETLPAVKMPNRENFIWATVP